MRVGAGRAFGPPILAIMLALASPVAQAGPLTCDGRQVTIEGTDDSETINGTEGPDVILAKGGADIVIAGDGDDVVCGGEGADDVRGGRGNDRLLGGAGNDIVRGMEGRDHVSGMGGDDHLFGGEDGGTADIDTVSYRGSDAGVRVDLTAGTTGPLDAGDSPGDGNDLVNGFEWVEGSSHDDHLIGNDEDNRLAGAAGSDLLDGRDGADDLRGGQNGEGGDTVTYKAVAASVILDLASGTARVDGVIDTLDSIENARGSSVDDRLLGDTAANVLSGGRGDDLLNGRGGADVMAGGRGSDTVSYASARSRVQVDLRAGTATVGTSQVDALESIENFTGSPGRDVVFGTGGANRLAGRGGNDELNGRAGKDVVLGGPGDDTLNGHKGEDLLKGAGGNDRLDGGPGRDRCRPGPGQDTLRNCP